ncbi:MAG: glycosyltransferase family 39 protein [Phycisphaerales bacterium]|nr:glycosyltransferase family 39 protein [Phycisphaerales bacterium]
MMIRVIALCALCGVVYATGLTTQGLTNWQESTRALVAREMQRSGEYLAPTMRGEPYIAKPPMIYWMQIGLAAMLGDEVGEWHLRAVVALVGMAGVVATYLVSRRMFRDGLSPPDAERGAWWSALGLAVSILYVRSSRTGELDILLAPFAVIGIGALHAAWIHAAERGRVRYGAVMLCAVCAIGAVMSKGPPALVCLGMAMVFGPMVWGAGASAERTRTRALGAGIGALAVIVLVVLLNPVRVRDVPGVMLMEAMGALAGWWIGALAERGVFGAWFGVLARTHPVGVLGAAVGVFWAWGWHLRRAFGVEAVAERAAREVGNNLNLFVPEAIEKNAGFLLYGSAPVAVAMGAGLVMIARDRVRLTRSMCLILAWLIGGFIVYSIAGKGVARYLTPLWPACAMVGGWFIAVWMGRMPRVLSRRRAAAAMSVVVLAFAGGQAWWYGIGRGAHNNEDSIRALAMELRGRGAAHVATWKFEDPALDLYLDRATMRFGEGDDEGEELAAHVREHGMVLLLVRDQTEEVMERYGSSLADIEEAGLTAREVEVAALYVRPPGRTRVRVYEVSLRE